VLLAKELSLPVLNVLGLTRPARAGLEHTTYRLLSESTTTRLRHQRNSMFSPNSFLFRRFVTLSIPCVLPLARIRARYLPITGFTQLCGRLFQVLNRSLSSSTRLYGWGSCLALQSYLVSYNWPLIRFACLTNVWRAVRFLSRG
jgi:hypothetical protein